MSDTAPQPPDERIGWAIVGLGDFASSQIIPAFGACARSKLVGLVSSTRDKALELAHQYGVPESGVYTYDTFDQIRDNPAVDVVYIIMPNALHAEYTLRAAAAGKHVFCEKPMAPTVEDCQRMIDACAQAERKLGIAYRAHFEPHNLLARQLLDEGAIGDLKLIIAEHARPLDLSEARDSWRAKPELAGGGPLVDIGIYGLNAARWFAGEEPELVWATAWSTPGDERFAKIEETLSFTLRFPGGVIANCATSYGCAPVSRYRLCGSTGWIELDPATAYHSNRLVLGRSDSREERTATPQSQFVAELDHFSQCVQENREPTISGAMGLQDVRVIEAIYRSAASGEPVRLTPANRPPATG